MINKIGIGFMRHDINNFEETQKIVDFAMSHNINYFESCYFYLNNQCENIVAKALKKYPRESYKLCAKMPVKGILEEIINPEIIFNQQLKNLNTNYFDIYLLQALDIKCLPILYQSKIIPFLLRKKKEGIIKKIGFSFHGTPDFLDKLLSIKCWDIVQLQLNYYDWYLSTGKENYEICEKYNIPIIVMGPTKGGTLINNLPKESIDILGKEYKFYPYKFLYSLPLIKGILTGAENLNQLKENYNFIFSDKNIFTKQDSIKIQKAIKIYKEKNFIQCTECLYCQPCPKDINIPFLFKSYNSILSNGIKNENFEKYINYTKEKNVLRECIKCGHCEKMCPQHLPIQKYFYDKIFQMRL